MLDPIGRQEVISTIRRLNKEMGITIVLITHFMEEAVLADRVIIMDRGSIVSEGTPREIFAQREFLREHKLDVPQATELCAELGLKECVLTPEEASEKIASVLGGVTA